MEIHFPVSVAAAAASGQAASHMAVQHQVKYKKC